MSKYTIDSTSKDKIVSMNHSKENSPFNQKSIFAPEVKVKKHSKTTLHLEPHKKGVMNFVSESIKSNFVDVFNKKRTNPEFNFLENYISNRVPSGKIRIKEEELKQSLNIISSGKNDKREIPAIDPIIRAPRKKSYSFRSFQPNGLKKTDSNMKFDLKVIC